MSADRDKRIVESLELAISLAEKAEATGDPAARLLLLWKATSEAEYAAFQISITRNLDDYHPSTSGSGVTVQDACKSLLHARTALGGDARSAYESVRKAIEIMRRTQAAILKPKKDLGA